MSLLFYHMPQAYIHASQKARKKTFDYDFGDIEIKGKSAKGNILSKYRVRAIKHKHLGLSTLSGIKIYYDNSIGRLNSDGRGDFIGKFNGDDMIIVFFRDGNYELTSFEITNRYDWNNILFLDKYNPDGVISSIYLDGKTKNHYVKRFRVETITLNKKFSYISQEKGSKLEYVTSSSGEIITYKHFSNKQLRPVELDVDGFIDVKGWKSIGNKILSEKIRSGTFKLKERIEKIESNIVNQEKKKEKKENFDVGESIELDLDSDQLNLFNEKD